MILQYHIAIKHVQVSAIGVVRTKKSGGRMELRHIIMDLMVPFLYALQFRQLILKKVMQLAKEQLEQLAFM